MKFFSNLLFKFDKLINENIIKVNDVNKIKLIFFSKKVKR